MTNLEILNQIPKYAIACPHPRFDYIYSIKYRFDLVLGRKVWAEFKRAYPNQVLLHHKTKKNKVILGGKYNKTIVDIISMSDIIKKAKKS